MVVASFATSNQSESYAAVHSGASDDVPRERENVYFFLDFSNIAISASQLACERGDGLMLQHKVRIHAENLRLLVERNRIWQRGFAAAGLSNPQSLIKERFEQCGIEFAICERGLVTGREQNVDQCIQLEMLKLIGLERTQGTIVLATGDGNGFKEQQGFINALSILHRFGFRIEVMSWRHSLNSELRNWTLGHGRLIELDDFYEDLTFVSGQRKPTNQSRLSGKIARRGLI